MSHLRPEFVALLIVGKDFVVLHQKKIGGELLDLNCMYKYKQN